MVKAKTKESGNEEDRRARLIDKYECAGSELRLIKFFLVIICLFKFFNMLLYILRSV